MSPVSNELPEVFGTGTLPRDAIARRVERGLLRRLAPGIYTSNLDSSLEHVVARNIWQLVALVAPDAVVADRTALEARPTDDGSYFIVSNARRRELVLPGLTIRPRPGVMALDDDMELPGGISMASRPRALLENFRPSRSIGGRARRTLTRSEIEERLELMLRTGGATALNNIRDHARKLAPTLDLEQEFEDLDAMVGALQGTRAANLTTAPGKARMAGSGYDPARLELFTILHAHLRGRAPLHRASPGANTSQLRHLPFFEAYFSNFIEGTEFAIPEAVEIVYQGIVPAERPQDAHDVLGTWNLVSRLDEMRQTPRDADEFLDLLTSRHAQLLASRVEKRPGKFKENANRAGSTMFVAPDMVEGTLRRAFELYPSLETGFERACYLMFVVAEVHPFDDGNGRIARVMMNAELIAEQEWRIIIPTVYRNNYLQALRALTHNANPQPLPRMLDFVQHYTALLDYEDVGRTTLLLERTGALEDPGHADATGIRLQLPTPGLFAEVEAVMNANAPETVWGEAIVEHAIWLPKHRSFVVALGAGVRLEVSSSPTFGEQTWLLIDGEQMSVKAEGMLLTRAANYRSLLTSIYQVLEREGDAAIIGRHFPMNVEA